MSERKKLSQDEFASQAGNLAKVLDRVRDLGFADVARVERARGAGLVRELARKKARTGAQTPEARAEAIRVSAQVERNTRVAAVRRTIDIGRDPNSDLRKVTGRVLDARGRPAAGIKVAVSKDAALRRPLETDLTDRSGTYLIETTRSKFAAYFRDAEEFVVTVLSKTGKPLREVRRSISAKDAPIRVVNFSLALQKPVPIDPDRPTPITLSDVSGLGPARVKKLQNAGIKTVVNLVRLTPAQLAEIIGVSVANATKILKAAREQLAAVG
jgi:predicted flap endonuclease-1-like 5' DNA nuclease